MDVTATKHEPVPDDGRTAHHWVAEKLKADPPEARTEHPAGNGLYFVRQPSGACSWKFRGRIGGKVDSIALGPVLLKREGRRPAGEGIPITLSEARDDVVTIKAQLRQGKDPRPHTSRSRLNNAPDGAPIPANPFGEVALRYIAAFEAGEAHSALRRMQHPPARRTLKDKAMRLGLSKTARGTWVAVPGRLVDRWASRPIADITHEEVEEALDGFRERGFRGRRTARGSTLLLTDLQHLFGYAVRKRFRLDIPTSTFDRSPNAPKRERRLSMAEIRAFNAACEGEGYPYGPMFKLMLLTGQRRSVVTLMEWGEVDGNVWTIPAGREGLKGKTGGHKLTLPQEALDLLTTRVEGCRFMWTADGVRPAASWSGGKDRVSARMGANKPWRLHDLRATMISGLADLGYDQMVINVATGHKIGSGETDKYLRDVLSDKAAEALASWAKVCTGG